MEFWTVTLICLAAGLVLVIGGALVVYMGSLVKSAYQLKIEIRSDVEAGQRHVEEELDKKVRMVKRDLVEEVEKVKAALQTDNQRRVSETLDSFGKRLAELEAAFQHDRAEQAKTLDSLRNDIAVLNQRQRALRREQKTQTAPAAAPTDPFAPAIAAAIPDEPMMFPDYAATAQPVADPEVGEEAEL